MKRHLYSLCYLLTLLSFLSSVKAQHVKYHKPISDIDAGNLLAYSVGIGATSYSGDVAGGKGSMYFRPAFSAGINYRFNPRFSINPTLTYLRFYAEDAHQSRNLGFYSNNFELSARLHGDVFPFKVHYHERKKVTPYGFIGIGLLYFNPKTDYNGETYNLRKEMTEGVKYSPVTFVVPLGVGLRYSMHHGFEVAVEGNLTKAFSDYLDDVSQEKYVDVTKDNNIKTSLHDRSGMGLFKYNGAKRGNPAKKDAYSLIEVKVIYVPVIHRAAKHLKDL